MFALSLFKYSRFVLVEYVGKNEGKKVYKIESQERKGLPALVVLFGIIQKTTSSNALI